MPRAEGSGGSPNLRFNPLSQQGRHGTPASPRPGYRTLSNEPPPSPRPGFRSLPAEGGPSYSPPGAPLLRPIDEASHFSSLFGESTELPPIRHSVSGEAGPSSGPVSLPSFDHLGLPAPDNAFIFPTLPFPPLHAPTPQAPPLDPHPSQRQQFLRDVNAEFDRNHADLPPSNPKVAFQGEDGSRIPTSADAPPGGRLNRVDSNPRLWAMVDRNYAAVREERRLQGDFLTDIALNPMATAGQKRAELARELRHIDNSPWSQHLTGAAREDLEVIGRANPELVDPAWFTPLRPQADPGSLTPSPSPSPMGSMMSSPSPWNTPSASPSPHGSRSGSPTPTPGAPQDTASPAPSP